MRLTLTTIMMAALIAACGGKSDTGSQQGTVYGDDFTAEKTMTLTEAAAAYADLQGQEICLEGVVQAMCVHKGDWLAWSEENTQVIVQFQGHSFTVPTDSKDKKVQVQGFLRDEPLPANCDNAENEQREAHVDHQKPDEVDLVEKSDDHAGHSHAEEQAEEVHEEHAEGEKETDPDGVTHIYFLATSIKILD